MDTIFTKIIKRELDAYIVYEDDLVIAFLDISQITKGHTLVVPKTPYQHFLELPIDLASHLFAVCQKVGHALSKAFHPEGFNLINNNGSIAGQSVFHFHMHVIPRYDQKEFGYIHESHTLLDTEYKERAALIKEALS